MARAVTMESIGEAAGAGSGPLPCNNTCRGWLGVPIAPINAASCPGPAQLRHSHHRTNPLQPVYLPFQQGPALAPALTPLPSPPCRQRAEVEAGSISGQLPVSDRAEHPEATGEQGPLPDLPPHNEHPPLAGNQDGASRDRAARELEARRFGHQLRAVGDEYNTIVLRRAHPVPNWEDWRDACRGLLTFITQTLSTLYRLT